MSLVAALEVEIDGEVVHTIKIDPPIEDDSSTLERILMGAMRNARDDAIFCEVDENGERL